ncbi:MAG TPA: CYTH and CHAD domain-containing protein [Actinophytocola sp.]|uniref:CYTH and CHAD domain-containing protein n=1 Tax=Actinophytocola sp. TaxID=1872138 RepID=UPI002DB96E1D|nr:CYTH and CHAD domain-containing protein [Actinophytocola sp.]HEU5475347.1 CYTH and CHAD domain-containing protein [Actinophytocola sp.]
MAATTHTETERKYDLAPETQVPVLDGLPGVVAASDGPTERLDAVYFDTEDLRLARSGLTLRRRTGGPDAGWHLKAPAGADTREETRLPLGERDDEPPAELVDLVTAYTRGARLVPVATLTTQRDRRLLLGPDGVLAEVTDDRVTACPAGRTASAGSWRELEIELAGAAGPALLEAAERRLDAAGIRRSASGSKLHRVLDLAPVPAGPAGTAGEVVRAYLRAQAETIARCDLLARKGTADAVHRLRVATRRMRSALRVFGRIVDRERTRGIEAELRWVARRLGPARDVEVRYERFQDAARALPAELLIGPVTGRLTRHFGPAEAAGRSTVLRTLRGRRYLRLLEAIEGMVTDPPFTPAATRPARTELPRHIRRAYRKVARRARKVRSMPAGPERDRATHDLRKAAKRFRYGVEAVAPVIGKPARRTRKRAKGLTRVLGEFQDSVVARPVLRDLGMQAHLSGENGFSFGMLYGREERAAERAYRDLWPAWRRAAKKKRRAWFRRSG